MQGTCRWREANVQRWTMVFVFTGFRVHCNTDAQSILIGDIKFAGGVLDSLGLATFVSLHVWFGFYRTVLLGKEGFHVKYSLFVLAFILCYCACVCEPYSILSKNESLVSRENLPLFLCRIFSPKLQLFKMIKRSKIM